VDKAMVFGRMLQAAEYAREKKLPSLDVVMVFPDRRYDVSVRAS